MPFITNNLYPGLPQGPISTRNVINAINSAQIAQIGNVVEINIIPEGELLPRVAAVSGSTPLAIGLPTMGIEVGGVRKGIYGTFPLSVFDIPALMADPTFIAGLDEGVRVCTKGICLANLVCRSNDTINVGDPLTVDAGVILFEGTLIFFNGFLRKAASGNFVIARALQAVPLGTPTDMQGRVAAVNVQREGIL